MIAPTPKGVTMNTDTKAAEQSVDAEFAADIDALRTISQQHPHITLHVATEILGLGAHTNAAQNMEAEITWLLTNHAAPEQVKAILERLTVNEKGEPRDIALDEQALLESTE